MPRKKQIFVRLPLDMPPEFHQNLKIHAVLAKENLKQYILRAITERQVREQLLVKYIDRPIDEA